MIKWTKTVEKMPAPLYEVLCVVQSDDSFQVQGMVVAYTLKSGIWLDASTHEDLSDGGDWKITHWMELPEFPSIENIA